MTRSQLGLFDARAPVAPATTPAQSRDETLCAHDANHAPKIAAATEAALALFARNGQVTAPEIPAEMRARGDGWMLVGDTRWMGAVLLPSRGWRNSERFVRTGSKGRPVPVWVRAT
jgi:hypothetical protein